MSLHTAPLPVLLLHSLIPARCPFCQSLPALGETICQSCFAQLHEAFSATPKAACLPGTTIPLYSGSRFVPSVSSALKRFKFSGDLTAGRMLARIWIDHLDLPIHAPHPLWLPVPLPATRRVRRGFNQSELLAQSLCKTYGGTVPSAMLRTAFYRPAMARQGRAGRQKIDHAFRLTPLGKKRLHKTQSQIWLVDDVCTTGTTLTRLAEVLLSCNPEVSLAAVTLAVA